MDRPATDSDDSTQGIKQVGLETYVQRRKRLLREYPEYCTAVDVSKMLRVTPKVVYRYKDKISHIIVDGMLLFHSGSATFFASTFVKSDRTSRLSVKGIDVERLQKLCEQYYRQNIDSGPAELLKLAKRLAKL